MEISVEEANVFLDQRTLGVGVFTYAIEAVDEVGNRSEQISQVLSESSANHFRIRSPLSRTIPILIALYFPLALSKALRASLVSLFLTSTVCSSGN